jgi:hypothetical protein
MIDAISVCDADSVTSPTPLLIHASRASCIIHGGKVIASSVSPPTNSVL